MSSAPATLAARDAYRLWANTYGAETVVTALEDRAVRTLSPIHPGARLLDAGCGTGRRLFPRSRGRMHGAVGVDLVFEMLAQARQSRVRATNVSLVAADLRALPLAAAHFDVVWCRLAVGHVQDLDRVYGELARVARADAQVIVTDFHPEAARAGHVRAFRDGAGELHVVEHYIHPVSAHLQAARQVGMSPVACLEPVVGRAARRFYVDAGRLAAYEEQRGLPLVLAIAFRTSERGRRPGSRQ